jgi:release factor glutamine methyltransferase
VCGQFDLILANPPYIGTDEALPAEVRDHEPAQALFAGPDGLDDYRRIVPDLPRLLAPGGIAVLEIGSTQAEAVSALVRQHGLAASVTNDLQGLSRVVSALETLQI